MHAAHRTRHALLILAVFGLAAAPAAAQTYTFTSISEPDATTNTLAYGINTLGQIAGHFRRHGHRS